VFVFGVFLLVMFVFVVFLLMVSMFVVLLLMVSMFVVFLLVVFLLVVFLLVVLLLVVLLLVVLLGVVFLLVVFLLVVVFLVSVVMFLVSVMVFLVSVVLLDDSSEFVNLERFLLDDSDNSDIDGIAMFGDLGDASFILSFANILCNFNDGLLVDLSVSLEFLHDDIAVFDNLFTALDSLLSFVSFADILDNLFDSLSCDSLNTSDSLSVDMNGLSLDDLDNGDGDSLDVSGDGSGASLSVLAVGTDVLNNSSDGFFGWSGPGFGDSRNNDVAVFLDSVVALLSLFPTDVSDDLFDGLVCNLSDTNDGFSSDDDDSSVSVNIFLLNDSDNSNVDVVAVLLDSSFTRSISSFTDVLGDFGDGLSGDGSVFLESSHDDIAVLDNLFTAINFVLSLNVFADNLDNLLDSLPCDSLNTFDSLS